MVAAAEGVEPHGTGNPCADCTSSTLDLVLDQVASCARLGLLSDPQHLSNGGATLDVLP